MRALSLMFLAVAVALSGCGNKSKLRTPAKIQLEQEKATRKQEREERKKAKEQGGSPDIPEEAPPADLTSDRLMQTNPPSLGELQEAAPGKGN